MFQSIVQAEYPHLVFLLKTLWYAWNAFINENWSNRNYKVQNVKMLVSVVNQSILKLYIFLCPFHMRMSIWKKPTTYCIIFLLDCRYGIFVTCKCIFNLNLNLIIQINLSLLLIPIYFFYLNYMIIL